MANITWDTSSLEKGIARLNSGINDKTDIALMKVCDEILRLSSFEVPHDKGLLQASGNHQPGQDEHERIVGYDKVYAARLHEHPEYHFQKGRKGKYLIDPILRNIVVFRQFIQDEIADLLR